MPKRTSAADPAAAPLRVVLVKLLELKRALESQAERSEGTEIGLRVALWGGRIQASLTSAVVCSS